MKNIIANKTRFQSAATALAAALGLLIGGFAPSKAAAGFEDAYLDSYLYFESLYYDYGYDYYTYYLGLALPSYYYYSAIYNGGYYSYYEDYYGSKGDFDSSGPAVFEYYADLGDTYFLSYY